jgi:DNA-binding NarL/FixJ family response regulator
MPTPLLAPASANPPDVDVIEPVHRVVLVDSREERRAITNLFVERCQSLTVVGLAGNLDEAEAQIRTQHAEVALVEIQMPVAEGLETIGALRDQFPELRVIVSSFHNDVATREAALQRGADAYLRKPLQIDDLLRVVTQ